MECRDGTVLYPHLHFSHPAVCPRPSEHGLGALVLLLPRIADSLITRASTWLAWWCSPCLRLLNGAGRVETDRPVAISGRQYDDGGPLLHRRGEQRSDIDAGPTTDWDGGDLVDRPAHRIDLSHRHYDITRATDSSSGPVSSRTDRLAATQRSMVDRSGGHHPAAFCVPTTYVL